MQTSQEILLLLPHKRLLPFLTYVIQHLRRIIITIPALGVHKNKSTKKMENKISKDVAL